MSEWICTICYATGEGAIPAGCGHCGATQHSIVPVPAAGTKLPPGEFSGLAASLDEVRNRARKRLKGICAAYSQCDGADDRICNNGNAYGNPIGMGGIGSGASFHNNFTALAGIRLRMRVVGEHAEPDMAFSFLGHKLRFPIMAASTSGVARGRPEVSELDVNLATLRGASEAGSLAWRGETDVYTEASHPSLDSLAREKGRGVMIFKPRHQDMLKRLIARAEETGCVAVGVDLDGCGSTNMERAGQPVFRKSARDIRELVSCTKLPFICKGILDPDDAEVAVESGARVIAVSNHGGRVLDHTPGVAEALPAIVERIRGRAVITADGGVRTGFDAIKLLALGADAVLMGRDVIRAAVGGGTAGVKMQMDLVAHQLRHAMLMTGCRTLADITRERVIAGAR